MELLSFEVLRQFHTMHCSAQSFTTARLLIDMIFIGYIAGYV